jgi:hypothetical protein
VELAEDEGDEVAPHRRQRHRLRRLEHCNTKGTPGPPLLVPMSFSSPLLAARAGKSMNVWSDERQAAYVPRTKTAARMPPCRRGRQGRRRQSTEASAAAGGELSTSMALSLSLSLSSHCKQSSS